MGELKPCPNPECRKGVPTTDQTAYHHFVFCGGNHGCFLEGPKTIGRNEAKRRWNALPRTQGGAVEVVEGLEAVATLIGGTTTTQENLDFAVAELERLQEVVSALPSQPDLREALERCQKALALVVRPTDTTSGLAITSAYAVCIEAEARARAALAESEK